MTLRSVRPVPETTLALMTTDRLHAYRRKLLDLPQSPDPEDITDQELESALDPAFLFFKDEPAWSKMMHAVMETLGQRGSAE